MRWTGKLSSYGDFVFEDDGEEVVLKPDGTPTSKFVKLSDEEKFYIQDFLSYIDYELVLRTEVKRMEGLLHMYKELDKSDYRRVCKLQDAYRRLLNPNYVSGSKVGFIFK
jgi:hypothetical protein